MKPSSLAFLKNLLDAPGPSGFEAGPARIWRAEAETFADEVSVDITGNSIAAVNPRDEPRIMFAGHVDEIGLMIVHVDDDGYLYFSTIGGWDPQVLVGQRVVIATRDGAVRGVIGRKAVHLLQKEERERVVKPSDLWIDIGAALAPWERDPRSSCCTADREPTNDYLLPQFDGLAPGHTLRYYDQRGGGRSAVPRDVAVGWKEHVEDLDALLDYWSATPATLLGYSWGGLLAMLYAVNHPRKVGRLALVSAAAATHGGREEFERRFAERMRDPRITEERERLRASGLRERDPKAYRQRAFELSVAAYFRNPALAHDLTPFRVTGRTQEAVWESLGDYDLSSELSALTVPNAHGSRTIRSGAADDRGADRQVAECPAGDF